MSEIRERLRREREEQRRKERKRFAPGARVVVRGEEWIVRGVKNATGGAQAVHVVGQSELVRDQEAIFLTDLDRIEELAPEETQLVADPSPGYRRTRLYLEALLRSTPPTSPDIVLGHRGAMNESRYQLEPAHRALSNPRPRLLIADGVGLGKTVEVGILLSELIQRGRGERILVVALKSILAQFQEELWARFAIPLVRLDSVGLERVRSRIPSTSNPFYHFPRCIISIDTLKKDSKYRHFLEDARWDVVVVDECQNVAVRPSGGRRMSDRARLAKLLARTSDALILTSATPHDGRRESFASLIDLLEPTAIADPADYTREDVEPYFIRRFKKDVDTEAGAFLERDVDAIYVDASTPETHAWQAISSATFGTIKTSGGMLFRTTLLKALLSSPAACSATLSARLNRLVQREDVSAAVTRDISRLTELRSYADAVTPDAFGKLIALTNFLRESGWDVGSAGERVVVFSERIDTLHYLRDRLSVEFGLEEDDPRVGVFYGSLDDQRQMRMIREFGSESGDLRLLLASDAAAEGLNLHHHCHRLVHFDIPWSLITLEQRNGRIDRFGQKHKPIIRYLLTRPTDERHQGDFRILQRLIQKEAEANAQLGDARFLLGLHDASLEEEHVAKGLESGAAPEEIIPDEPALTESTDLLAILDAALASTPDPEAGFRVLTSSPLRLYPDDLAWARASIAELNAAVDETGRGETTHVEWHDAASGFSVFPSDDFERRLRFLPPEIRPAADEPLKLTTDRELVMSALAASRRNPDDWPEWQLFWPLHPVAEWLSDRILSLFTRHEAPLLQVQGAVEPDHAAFLIQGIISNNRSQPIIADWSVYHLPLSSDPSSANAVSEALSHREPFADFVTRVGLDDRLVNTGQTPDPAPIAPLKAPAINAARAHMRALRDERANTLKGDMRAMMKALQTWKTRSLARIQKVEDDARRTGRRLSRVREKQLRDEQHEIERLHAARQEWIQETASTSDLPYLRIAGVFV